MRDPIHAGHFLGVELYFLVDRPAQAVKQIAFDDALETQGIDNQSAFVRAHHPLYPDVSCFAIYLNLSDHRDNRLASAGV